MSEALLLAEGDETGDARAILRRLDVIAALAIAADDPALPLIAEARDTVERLVTQLGRRDQDQQRQAREGVRRLRWQLTGATYTYSCCQGRSALSHNTSRMASGKLDFPPQEPLAEGSLDVGDGQLIHWELSGNPSGKPAVALHGGPGSGLSPGRRRSFDPRRYLLVQFDQRGCGLSTPSVADVSTELTHNTTEHLIEDIEQLRQHLGIERWLVWGGSWGVTLGLAYAERYPERVSEMVLVSVTLSRPADIHWLYHEVGRYFPEEWHRFRNAAGAQADPNDLLPSYDRLLNAHPEAAVRAEAAKAWCNWEDTVLSLEPGWAPSQRFRDAAFRMTFARLCAHYFSRSAWLEEDELLHNAGALNGIPAVLIHGRLDLGGPADVAWLLHRAWPESTLQLVRSGHNFGEELQHSMVAAIDGFADR